MTTLYQQLAQLADQYGAQRLVLFGSRARGDHRNNKKIEHYINALGQLEQAAEIYGKAPQDELYRDGLIQRFEFTVELAWKSIKDYLEDQGTAISIATPRAILKEAFAAGIIQNADAWNQILTARNVTSHVYDEKTADEVAEQICTAFLPFLKDLRAFYIS